MGHNVSRDRKDRIERERELERLEPLVVPGWQIDRARVRIVEERTVLGFHQRGQQMLLRCRRDDCRRRAEIDFHRAVLAGHGGRPVADVVAMLRCRHWDGCRLEEASAIYPEGVPLVGFLQDANVLIAIACAGCDVRLLLPPELVIQRLKAAGRGDGSTGLHRVATAVRGPCRRCGGRRFSVDVVRTKAP